MSLRARWTISAKPSAEGAVTSARPFERQRGTHQARRVLRADYSDGRPSLVGASSPRDKLIRILIQVFTVADQPQSCDFHWEIGRSGRRLKFRKRGPRQTSHRIDIDNKMALVCFCRA
jgi:hypothetical protein